MLQPTEKVTGSLRVKAIFVKTVRQGIYAPKNQKFEKTVTKHIWSDYLEKVEDIRHTPGYKALYERRKETIERVFADAKEKYAMRYTPYRGLSQVTNWVRLKFAAMNLKKYALHRWKRSHQYSALIRLYTFFVKTKFITLNFA